MWHVPKKEAVSTGKALTQIKPGTEEVFVSFDTISGRTVYINCRYVLLCQVLWQGELKTLQKTEEEPDARIYLQGRAEPLEYLDADTEELRFVTQCLDNDDALSETMFVAITDEDGERNLIPISKIIFLDSIEDYTKEKLSEP